ncbi:MAG: DUF357 domain-containing protein [Candidatus Altiarchaeota archaeon]|nr:DUF357 domain-containing protein [Candidatus Altiarchaeota archaeon]
MNEFKLKVETYLKKAAPLFERLEDAEPKKIDLAKSRREFREMALGYYSDAKHFYDRGEYANALAALEYAEGWMDAGKRLGIFQ